MRHGNRVLVIEDDFVVRLLLEELLEDAGFEAVPAANGDRALELLATTAPRLCAAVIDLRPGADPDGWTVARRTRSAAPVLPILYVTGGPTHAWPKQGLPASAILAKPFRRDDFLKVLRELLAQPVQSGARPLRRWDH